MTSDNVRVLGPSITHAKAHSERQITRCGIEYVRSSQYMIGDVSQRPMGHRTNADVDCMTCLVKDEWHNTDFCEIILAIIEGKEPSR